MEQHLGNLSTGQLRRLSNALVQYPISDKLYIELNSSQTLKDANNIGQRMLEAKSMMFLQTVAEFEQAQQQAQVESVVDNKSTNGE